MFMAEVDKIVELIWTRDNQNQSRSLDKSC